MSFAWYEAIGIFLLWFIQFVGPLVGLPEMHHHVTIAYFAWCLIETLSVVTGRRAFRAFGEFAKLWREHIAPAGQGRA
jgi:hypothetical protein